jgi:hypothetical protein
VVTVRRREGAPRTALLVLAALAAGLAGCGNDFNPRSFLDGTRVLALVAIPPPGEAAPRLEVGPGEVVAFQAHTFGVDAKLGTWSFCPFTLGSSAGFACAVPGCETPLGGGAPSDIASAAPYDLALACVAALSAGGATPPAGVPTPLPRRVDTLLRYRVTGPDGLAREAVQVVPLYPAGAPATRNLAPVVTSVSIGGAVVSQGQVPPPLAASHDLVVQALLDPSSAQSYTADDGTAATETLVVSFYTTAGRFDFDRASGLDGSVKLKAEKLSGETEAQVYAVARDLRGGETVVGPFTVPIQP